MSIDTVEWGDEPKPRRMRFAIPGVNAWMLAVALTILGFVLALGAEVLPWLTITFRSNRPPELGPNFDETMHLTQLVVWQAPAYYVGLTALLALTAVTLLGRPAVRRGTAAAALGCAAGQLVLLVGLFSRLSEGSDFTGQFNELRDRGLADFATDAGLHSAFGATLLLAGAVAVETWVRRTPRTTPEQAEQAGQAEAAEAAPEPAVAPARPLDLVVTQVESFERPAEKL